MTTKKQQIFTMVVNLNPDSPYSVVLQSSRPIVRKSAVRKWDAAVKAAKKSYGDEWNFDDVVNILVKEQGFTEIKHIEFWGE